MSPLKYRNDRRTSTVPRGRVGNAYCCEYCSRPLRPRGGSRRQKFCDAGCRKRAFRARKWANCYRTPGAGRSVQNRPSVSKSYKGDFADRTSSIVGPQIVIEREIIAGRDWKSVVSPDGVTCEVTRYRRSP
jgi:hypothetical protein